MLFLNNYFSKSTRHFNSIKNLNPADYADAITDEEIVLVDIRRPEEYKQGHIMGAINIDCSNQTTFKKAFDFFDKEQEIFIYCHSGIRSQRAAKKLIEVGFRKVYDLKGGYMAWKS